MNSRETILQAIRKAAEEKLPLPDIRIHQETTSNILASFIERVVSIGGECEILKSVQELRDFLTAQQKDPLLVNGIPALDGYNLDLYAGVSAYALQSVQTVLLEGSVAVAENGAIWLPEKNMGNRLLPFICEHLALVIESEAIVSTMHDAYKQLSVSDEGYGVFIAGPSKTADIEQALVIGAHGPLRLTVFILQKS